jgi:uncharacterized protein YacL
MGADADGLEPRPRRQPTIMITSEGFGLIAELIAAVLLIAAITGFAVRRTARWLLGVAITFTMLIAAVTILIESST